MSLEFMTPLTEEFALAEGEPGSIDVTGLINEIYHSLFHPVDIFGKEPSEISYDSCQKRLLIMLLVYCHIRAEFEAKFIRVSSFNYDDCGG